MQGSRCVRIGSGRGGERQFTDAPDLPAACPPCHPLQGSKSPHGHEGGGRAQERDQRGREGQPPPTDGPFPHQ